jgi:myosin-9
MGCESGKEELTFPSLFSDREDVENFLSSLSLNQQNYQLGRTKIFLREVEKIKLDYFLHQQIMASIVSIQRWYRTSLERRHFLHIREAAIRIQVRN